MNPFLRVLAVVLVLAAAGLAIFAFYLARQPAPAPVVEPMSAPQPQTAKPAETVPVVVAARDLSAGTALSASVLRTAQWPAAPAQAYTGSTALDHKVLRFDVREGQPITSFLLTGGLAHYLEPDQRAIDIPVAAPVNWRSIRPGDMVDVFFTLNQGGEIGVTQSRLLLSRTRVLAYGGRTLDQPAPAKDDADDAKAPTHAMIAVPQERVNSILLAAAKGQLQFALRSVQDTSEPDPALFPERESVLASRTDLDAADQLRLQEPANKAYAGESLGEVAATQAAAAPSTSTPESAPSSRPAARTVQIIRGNQITEQPY